MRMMMPLPVALLLAGGAAAQQADRTSPGFGNSVRHNIMVQVVDMNPQHANTEMEGGNGMRSADAVTRYEEGRVIQPRGVTASGAQIEQGGGGGRSQPRAQ